MKIGLLSQRISLGRIIFQCFLKPCATGSNSAIAFFWARLLIFCLLSGLLGGLISGLFSATANAQSPQNPQNQQDQQDPINNESTENLYLEAIQSISEGRKEDAGNQLNRLIAKEPQHAGALLDLALIQCELGNAIEAERLFQIIETRFQPPPAILEVINLRRQVGCAKAKRQKRGGLSLSRGYDENVNQGSSNPSFTFGGRDNQVELQLAPEFLPRADNYSIFSADYSQELTENGGIGFAQFSARENDQLRRFNNVVLFLGFEQAFRYRKWAGRTTGTVGFFGLGGQFYQRQGQAQLQVTPPLTLPENWQLNLSGGVSNTQFLTQPDFNATTFDLRTQLNYATPQTQVQASITFSFDRANADRPGGDRKGWMGQLRLHNQITSELSGEVNLNYQTWLGQSAYSPNVIDQTRDQQTSTLRTSLQYALNPRQSLQLEFRRILNRDNISIFQYSNQQLQFTYHWRY